MYADLRMIPHESALFSSACKPTSLGVVSGQVTAKASASQVPWLALCVWLQKGVREDMAWSKHIDLYAFSRGSFRKKARNLIETAQRKGQSIDIYALSSVIPRTAACNMIEPTQRKS